MKLIKTVFLILPILCFSLSVLAQEGISSQNCIEVNALKSLKKLYLWQSKVTPEGAKALKKMLPNTYIHSHTPKITVKPEPAKKPAAKGKK